MAQPLSSGAYDHSAGCSGFVRVWCIAAVVLIVLRPIDAPGFWWHLSRGREVAEGSMSPSVNLISLEWGNEADWAGGLPFFVLWIVGGPYALSMIPLIAAALLLLFFGRRVSIFRHDLPLILLPLFFWMLRDSLQPTPELIDLIGLLTVGWVWGLRLTVRSRTFRVITAFVCWANMGPQVIWGLLWILLNDPGGAVIPGRGRTVRPPSIELADAGVPRLLFAVAALAGGALTPRVLLTWVDSAVLLVGKALEPHPEAGLFVQGQDILTRRSVCTFLVLLIWLILYVGDQRISSRIVGSTDRRVTVESCV